jgi:ribosomal-protein-alanine N-acetyltransferase
VIRTSRLLLRPCATGDLDSLHGLWTNPEVRRHLWDDVVITRERAAEVLAASTESFAKHNFGFWAVTRPDASQLIGFCGFRMAEGSPELLFGIAPEYWGRGLATEAALAVLRYGFDQLQFPHVIAGADEPNAASHRVLLKLGFKLERHVERDGRPELWYRLSRPGQV